MNIFFRAISIFLLSLGSVTLDAAFAQSTEISGIANVIDGDTLNMGGLRIRLYGVDAPEFEQTCNRITEPNWLCGHAAAQALSDKVANSKISCLQKDIDNYRRIVSVCHLNGEDINAWLVNSGWAIAYLEYSQDYVAQEEVAKAARLGIWNSNFVTPEKFRTNQNQLATQRERDQPNCMIKGNINNRGERIYHVPSGEFYERTIIDSVRGERKFCTEEEALAAGWRRSQR